MPILPRPFRRPHTPPSLRPQPKFLSVNRQYNRRLSTGSSLRSNMPTYSFLYHHRNFDHHHHHADPPISSPSPPPPKPNQKILSLFLKSIIMGLIISTFLLFLGIATIAFIHILILGSFLHRRRRISTLSSPTTTTSSSSLPSPGAYSLDQLQKYLPPFIYTTMSVTASQDCSICLEYFSEGEFCRTLPACSHVFHASCVNQWLTRVPNCPVCRARVQLNGGASESNISDEDFKLLWTIGV